MSVPLHKMVNGEQVPLTQEEIDDFNKREKEFNENQAMFGYLDIRKAHYPKESEKVEALWELMANNNQQPLMDLKARMLAIDLIYPKPT